LIKNISKDCRFIVLKSYWLFRDHRYAFRDNSTKENCAYSHASVHAQWIAKKGRECTRQIGASDTKSSDWK